MTKLKALLFGQCVELTMALPSMLARSGFEVDLIFTNNTFKKSKFVKNLEILHGADVIENLSKRDLDIYDFIIPCDDEALRLVINSNLPIEKKLKILPVATSKSFSHIFSKIGLSKTLSQAGVLTPPFMVANGSVEAKKCAENLGYPVILKANSSNGGRDVIECYNDADVELIRANFFHEPILVQKKISGTELDLSAIYRDKKLIFFSHSEIKEVIANKFGPSVVRLYKQRGALDQKIFLEMQKLGEALEANGFVTISCIETADKKRYFFEADMRPNSWSEFPKFFGDDPAIKIAKWFSKKEILSHAEELNENYSREIILPYFNRMRKKEILLNRHQVWKYLPYEDRQLLIFLLCEKFLLNKIFNKVFYFYKKTKRLPLLLIRLIVPQKTDRAEIRNKIKQGISVILQIFPGKKISALK
jgi:hypothetical protein